MGFVSAKTRNPREGIVEEDSILIKRSLLVTVFLLSVAFCVFLPRTVRTWDFPDSYVKFIEDFSEDDIYDQGGYAFIFLTVGFTENLLYYHAPATVRIYNKTEDRPHCTGWTMNIGNLSKYASRNILELRHKSRLLQHTIHWAIRRW